MCSEKTPSGLCFEETGKGLPCTLEKTGYITESHFWFRLTCVLEKNSTCCRCFRRSQGLPLVSEKTIGGVAVAVRGKDLPYAAEKTALQNPSGLSRPSRHGSFSLKRKIFFCWKSADEKPSLPVPRVSRCLGGKRGGAITLLSGRGLFFYHQAKQRFRGSP